MDAGSGSGTRAEGELRLREPFQAIISDELSSAVEFVKQIAVKRRASVQNGAKLSL